MYMNLVAMLNILENVHLIKLGSHLLIGEKLWSCAMLTLAVGQVILVVPVKIQNREHLVAILYLLHMKQGTHVQCPSLGQQPMQSKTQT